MYNWITVLYTWNKHEFTALPIGRITVWTLPPIRPEVALDSHRSMNWNPTVKVENHEWSEVAQVCPTLWDLVHCSLPGSSIHGIFQARRLEWTAISFSRENIMRLPQNTEKAMAPHSSTLAWKILWTEEPGRLQSMGSLRVGHDWATSLSTFHFHALEKEMATHSSVLAWRIPGTGEPSGLPSMGSHSQTRLKRLRSSSSHKIEIKCTINVMCLNLAKPSPHFPVHGEIVFHKTSP